MATSWRATRLIPRVLLSMVLGTALAATVAAPGHAQPGEVPDAGDRPAPAGDLPLPDGSFAQPPDPSQTLTGPLAAEIAELEIEVQALTAELQTIEPEISPAEAALSNTDQQWRTAGQELEDAQRTLDELVGDSYRGAAALPPDLFIPELRGLSAHAPVPVEAPLGAGAAARNLVDARAAEREAATLFETAQGTEQELSQRQTTIEAELARLEPQLERLRDRNAALLAEAERAREAAAQEQDFPVGEPVAGFRAGAAAIRAVEFALRQLGKPYQWGAEGPDRFDCSGLMWAAYRSVGRTLPRVAADQYWGTRTRLVAQNAMMARQGLLPGDLVFFASGPAWQSIHHVGMYVGNGQMVHAPNSREVVKVSPVWWSRFFAATRVVDAVRVADPSAPGPGPTTPGPTTPGPTTPGPTTPGPTTPGPEPTDPDPDPTTPGPRPTTPDPEPTTVTVPNLAGMTAAEAAAALRDAGLDPSGGAPVTEGCPASDADLVVRQEPAAGASVRVGSTVIYRICDPPPELVQVPAGLVGTTRAEAEAALAAAGLTAQIVEVSSSAPVGQVIRTDPPEGSSLAVNGTVILEVSLGDLVPNVEDLTCEEAIALLEERGLEIVFAGDPTIGTVESQVPPAGEERPADGTVTLTGCADPDGSGEPAAASGPARFDTLQLAGTNKIVVV